MIVARVPEGPGYLVVGTVRGLASDAARLPPALDEYRPSAVALAISADELRGLREYFLGSSSEPLVTLTGNELAEIRGLARYGEVRVPNPSWTTALAWGEAHAVPVHAVDPSDETYAEMFAGHISYAELVRRTLRERSLTRHPPAPTGADEYALAWSRRLASKGGSARLARARDEAAVAAARTLGVTVGRVAVLVDRERFDGIVGALGHPPGEIAPGGDARRS